MSRTKDKSDRTNAGIGSSTAWHFRGAALLLRTRGLGGVALLPRPRGPTPPRCGELLEQLQKFRSQTAIRRIQRKSASSPRPVLVNSFFLRQSPSLSAAL